MKALCSVCQTPITGGLMCARHWRLVPPQIKTRVWATRDEAQRRGKSPAAQALATKAYDEAAADARSHLLTYFPEESLPSPQQAQEEPTA